MRARDSVIVPTLPPGGDHAGPGRVRAVRACVDGRRVSASECGVTSETPMRLCLNYEISIFPNPFKQHTNLAVYSSNAEKMNIEIYNNLGKVVYNHDVMLGIGMNNVKIESSDLLPGLYYMNVMINGENNLKPLTIIK